MNLTSEQLILLGAAISLASAFIATLGTLVGTLLTKRSEERRHYRDLIINAAVQSWKHTNEILIARNLSRMLLVPLDNYIIHMIKFSELIMDKKFDSSNIEEKLKELNAISEKVSIHLKNQYDSETSR